MVRLGKKEEKECGEKVSKGQGRVGRGGQGRGSKIRIRNGEESNDLLEGQDVKKMFSCLYNLIRGKAIFHPSKYHIKLYHIISYHISPSTRTLSFFLSFLFLSFSSTIFFSPSYLRMYKCLQNLLFTYLQQQYSSIHRTLLNKIEQKKIEENEMKMIQKKKLKQN